MNYFKWLKLDIVKRFEVVNVIFQYRHVPILPDQIAVERVKFKAQ